MFSKILASLVFVFAVFFIHATASAATLSLSPSSGSYSVGKTIAVRVLVGSGGQSINAVSGNISFSTETLSLSSISKGGIVSLWAQNPSYSNSSGTATFQGVILNGYSGGAGTIVTLNFKAKAAGLATINLSSANSSVLLNDGQGTNVLTGTSGASFTITPGGTTAPVTKPTAPVTEPTTEPETPVVTPPATGAAPLFTDYESPLLPGNFVVVKGTGDKNSLITITFTQSSANGAVKVAEHALSTNDAGAFTFVSDEKATEGNSYTLVATGKDGQHTEPLHLSVKNSLSYSLGLWFAALLAIKISALLALLILILISGYLLYRNHLLKKHLAEAIDRLHEVQEKQ